MTDWTNADYADGPMLAAWLRDGRLPLLNEKHGDLATFARAIQRWEKGSKVSVESVDRWLTMLGYHLSELPSELWHQGYSPGLRRRQAA